MRKSFWTACLAGRMPKPGRIALTPMLNERGKLIGDFTVARLAADRFFLFGAGVAEDYHMRWFERHLPASGVTIARLRRRSRRARDRGAARHAISWQGSSATTCRARPFRSRRSARWKSAVCPAWVGRISFTGDLGYEIWVKPDISARSTTGSSRRARNSASRIFGARALARMRLEKGYGTWAREYRPIYTPREAGLDRSLQ